MKKLVNHILHKCDFKENEHGTVYACDTCGKRYVPPHFGDTRATS